MLLIVAHHYVVNSGLTDAMSLQPTSSHSIFLYLLGAWGKTGINCFVLITGYFMCESHITLRKFLKLLLQIEFYSVVIGLLFMLTGYTTFTWRGLIAIINPIDSVSKGFTSCFLLFYLFIPFLNICIRNISQRQHLYLLMLCVFTYTLVGSVPILFVDFNYVTWFCVLYIIASYIRRYPLPHDKSFRFWSAATLMSLLAAVLSMVAIMVFEATRHTEVSMGLITFFLSDSHKILALAVSISSFMMFKNMKLPKSRVINTIASCTFGVLLIHAASDDMRRWLWRDTCNNVGMFQSVYLYWHALLVPLAVFGICALIDYIRQRTIEQPLLNMAERRLSSLWKKHLTFTVFHG